MSEKVLPKKAPYMTPGVREQFGMYVRETRFEPGFGLTPNYGQTALKIRHLLHGQKGTTQFLWSTGLVPEKQPRGDRFGKYEEWKHSAPTGFDRGYHADEPNWDGHEEWGAMDKCDVRPGGKCFYDGSGIGGDEVLTLFFEKGEEAMWQELERYYVLLFGEPTEQYVMVPRA